MQIFTIRVFCLFILFTAAASQRRLMVGGIDVDVSHFSFVGSLYDCSKKPCQHACTLSLLSPVLAVTAAHCVTEYTNDGVFVIKPEAFQVAFDKSDHISPDENAYFISEIVVHPKYDNPIRDVAVLHLSQPVLGVKANTPRHFLSLPTQALESCDQTAPIITAGFGHRSPVPANLCRNSPRLSALVSTLEPPSVCKQAYIDYKNIDASFTPVRDWFNGFGPGKHEDVVSNKKCFQPVLKALESREILCYPPTQAINASADKGDSGGPVFALVEETHPLVPKGAKAWIMGRFVPVLIGVTSFGCLLSGTCPDFVASVSSDNFIAQEMPRAREKLSRLSVHLFLPSNFREPAGPPNRKRIVGLKASKDSICHNHASTVPTPQLLKGLSDCKECLADSPPLMVIPIDEEDKEGHSLVAYEAALGWTETLFSRVVTTMNVAMLFTNHEGTEIPPIFLKLGEECKEYFIWIYFLIAQWGVAQPYTVHNDQVTAMCINIKMLADVGIHRSTYITEFRNIYESYGSCPLDAGSDNVLVLVEELHLLSSAFRPLSIFLAFVAALVFF